MDPYCKVRFGVNEQKTTVHDNGGQFPEWNQEFQFKRLNEEDVVYVSVYNKNNLMADTFIGFGGFGLTSARKGDKKVERQVPIYGVQGKIGDVTVAYEFKLVKHILLLISSKK